MNVAAAAAAGRRRASRVVGAGRGEEHGPQLAVNGADLGGSCSSRQEGARSVDGAGRAAELSLQPGVSGAGFGGSCVGKPECGPCIISARMVCAQLAGLPQTTLSWELLRELRKVRVGLETTWGSGCERQKGSIVQFVQKATCLAFHKAAWVDIAYRTPTAAIRHTATLHPWWHGYAMCEGLDALAMPAAQPRGVWSGEDKTQSGGCQRMTSAEQTQLDVESNASGATPTQAAAAQLGGDESLNDIEAIADLDLHGALRSGDTTDSGSEPDADGDSSAAWEAGCGEEPSYGDKVYWDARYARELAPRSTAPPHFDW